MSPLDRKLLRDLWRIKGQAIAIGLVIAMGVMMQVMMTGVVASLTETRDAYYDRYRLADVFAPAARAPERLRDRLARLEGVARVETRVVGSALIDIDDRAAPVQAQAISLPDRGRPALNDIYLAAGRMPEVGREDEILLLRSFAAAHALQPGDTLEATLNGARRSFNIVGLAESPEWLYTTAPGEIVPDDARFGVVWMSRSALAAAYDMDGAFNEALLSLTPGARAEAAIGAVDRLLEPYGGAGAYALADQLSNKVLSEEIIGLEKSAGGAPPVFLAVAAFLLYIVVGRMVQSEREKIGLLKAFGYSDLQVGGHYFKLILAIAVGGALAGCLGGIALGRGMISFYTDYFKFPFIVFQLDPASFVIGVSASVVSASAGGLLVLRQVFRLTPADAMRPPAPPDYSRTVRIGGWLGRRLDQPTRMVVRRLARQPVRMIGATIGIAFGMALSVAMVTLYAGFDRTLDLTFSVLDRSDVTVTFTQPVSEKTLFELARMEGVQRVEPVRSASVILRNGRLSRRGALTGLPADAELYRAVDSRTAPIILPESGVVLSRALADLLAIRAGDTLTVEVREGRRPTLRIPVGGVAETFIGAPAYMELDALNRALREPGRVSGAHLLIDEAAAETLYARLQDMPIVAGVSVKADARRAVVALMDTGAASMRYVMGLIAFVITFGIVYNAARIALAERMRDLASIRVLGFSKGEAAFVLLGEVAVVTLVALPLGALLGYGFNIFIAAGFSTELYQIQAFFDPPSVGQAMLVVLGAALISGWLVKRDLDRADLIEAMKTRE